MYISASLGPGDVLSMHSLCLCGNTFFRSSAIAKMLSFVYLFSFLAAGSVASPCKPSGPTASSPAGNATSGPAPGSKAALQLPNSNSILSSANSSASLALPGSTNSQGGGLCPPGFMNTVFNTNAPKNGGWPGTTWSSLSSRGINNWSKWNGVSFPSIYSPAYTRSPL